MRRLAPPTLCFSTTGLIRLRTAFAHALRLELLAVRKIVDTFARGRHPFPGGDRRGVPDDGDEVPMRSGLDPQHAKTVVGVVEVHPLDQAGENLTFRC